MRGRQVNSEDAIKDYEMATTVRCCVDGMELCLIGCAAAAYVKNGSGAERAL